MVSAVTPSAAGSFGHGLERAQVATHEYQIDPRSPRVFIGEGLTDAG